MHVKEIEALKKPVVAAPANEAKAPDPMALKEDGEPVYPMGDYDPMYVRDLTRYTINQERVAMQAEMAQQRQQAELEQQGQALQSTWNGKVQEAIKEYPDFVEKGQALLNGFNDLSPDYGGYLTSVLMNMDHGTEVLYYLSNHPEEARTIVNSGAQKATLALGRLESRFMKSEQDAPKPKISQAPAPPPVRARGTNAATVVVAPDTDDQEAFEREFFKPRKY